MKNTLEIRFNRSIISQILYVALFLLFFLILLELFVRNHTVKSILPYPSPSINSNFPDLDIKFSRLENIQKVDCLFIGSSMVLSGLDPKVFEKVVYSVSGQNLTCINMGFSGSMVETSGAMAKSLISWQPIKLVIWGISPIEMDKNFTSTRSVAKLPVFTYNEGKPSLEGWLYNSFDLPWYFFALPHSFNPEYKRYLNNWNEIIDDRGLRILRDKANFIYGQDNIILRDFEANPVDLDMLQSTITLFKDRNIQVIVIEMPVYPKSFPYLVEGGESSYTSEFLRPIEDIFRSKNTPFIRTQPIIEQVVGNNDWMNINHLNYSGSSKFSSFIAKKILTEENLY